MTISTDASNVRKVIPVEQGLRQGRWHAGKSTEELVRKVIPVEQGLRLNRTYQICSIFFDS